MNRFFVLKNNINETTISIQDPEEVKHISKVLRLKPKEKIEVSDGEQYEYLAEISNVSRDHVEAVVLEKQPFQREPLTLITLYQSIPKHSKMESIVQKSVELGVFKITPFFSERTVVKDRGNFHKKVERWQKISNEASKQCKRGIIPKVEDPLDFHDMLVDIQNKELVLFLYEDEKITMIKNILKKQNKNKINNLAVIVGSEGGFSLSEVKHAKEAGAISVSLGKTILRTETAGAAALAMILYELEG